MIKIDFRGSTHGHFLEYVVNIYIMQTTPSQRDIFKPGTLSAHNADRGYLKDRMVFCGHFSECNMISDSDVVIRITTELNDDLYLVALTNLIHKAGDIGVDRQLLNIPEHTRNSRSLQRNNWFSKFNESHLHGYNYSLLPSNNVIVDFNYESFFDYNKFVKELNKVATSLDQTFFNDRSLFELWTKFISVNQGWQSLTKCLEILNYTYSDKSLDFVCTSIEEGWINYQISKANRLYDGELFTSDTYPTNTKNIYCIIQKHLESLR